MYKNHKYLVAEKFWKFSEISIKFWWISRSTSHSILLWLKQLQSITQAYTAKHQTEHIFVVWRSFVSNELTLLLSTFFSLFERTLMLYTTSFGHLHFFKNDAFCVWSTTERIGLPTCSQMSFFVVFVSPTLITTVVDVFSRGTETSWLACKIKNSIELITLVSSKRKLVTTNNLCSFIFVMHSKILWPDKSEAMFIRRTSIYKITSIKF